MTRREKLCLLGSKFIASVALLFLSALPMASRDAFSKGEIINSPNKKYAIQDIGRTSDDDPERCHTYFIVRSKNKRRPLLVPSTGSNYYEHNVDYYWCPDSTKFAMSEVAPSLGEVYLYYVNDLDHPVVISKRLESELKKQVGEINGRLDNLDSLLHLYIEPKRWINSKSLELAVDFAYLRHDLKGKERERYRKTGIRPGATFHWLYSWDLGKTFKKIRKLSDSE